ncbi:MAG: hypothetical protein HY904_13910 [Deltaproteobacteria bacterium]|nr:hypothetical protein [Deltaproteobacteria bacterium]
MPARLRVDNVTGVRRWAVEAYGHVAAALIWVLLATLRPTLRIRHTGRPAALPDGGLIECAWHEHLPAYFLACLPYRTRYVWMNHPAWYMRPIHVLLRWSGVGTLVLGSSGNDGWAALARVADQVGAGASTFLNPDGPYGPARVLKDGVLELSARTGRPVVALSFHYGAAWRLPTWDGKRVPVPFSTVEVRWAPPVVTTDRERARAAVTEALGT